MEKAIEIYVHNEEELARAINLKKEIEEHRREGLDLLDKFEPVLLFYMGLVFALCLSLLFTISYNKFPNFFEENFWGFFIAGLIGVILVFIIILLLFFYHIRLIGKKRKKFKKSLKKTKNFLPKEREVYERKIILK